MTPRPNLKILDVEHLAKQRLDAHWAWQEGRRFTPRDDHFIVECLSWAIFFFLLITSVWLAFWL